MKKIMIVFALLASVSIVQAAENKLTREQKGNCTIFACGSITAKQENRGGLSEGTMSFWATVDGKHLHKHEAAAVFNALNREWNRLHSRL